MPIFMHLPPELKLYVAEDLVPDDCFGFATTCKAHWSLCDGLIKKHKLLSKQHSVKKDADGYSAFHLAKDLLENREVTQYVKELEISAKLRMSDRIYAEQHIMELCRGFGENRLCSAPIYEFLKKFGQALLRSLPWDRRWNIDQAERRLSRGTIVAKLITILPWLKVLRLKIIEGAQDIWLLSALHEITLSYENGVTTLPFQALTRVHLSHWNVVSCVWWRWVYFFCKILSLQVLSGFMIGGNLNDCEDASAEREYAEIATRTPRLNVRELSFSYSRMSAEVVELLLSNMRNLKAFSFNSVGGDEVCTLRHEPRRFIAALLRHCAHSLEQLELGDYGDSCRVRLLLMRIRLYKLMIIKYMPRRPGPHPIHSFSGFQKLHTLYCTFTDIIPEDEVKDSRRLGRSAEISHGKARKSKLVFDPTGLFPSCLHTLYIEGSDDNLSMDDQMQIFDVILRAKDSALPNLKQLSVALKGQKDAVLEGQRQLEEKAARCGINYIPIRKRVDSEDLD